MSSTNKSASNFLLHISITQALQILLVVTTLFSVLISYGFSISSRGKDILVINLPDIKQCDAPELNNVNTGIESIEILPVITSPITCPSIVRLCAWPSPHPALCCAWLNTYYWGGRGAPQPAGPRLVLTGGVGNAHSSGVAGNCGLFLGQSVILWPPDLQIRYWPRNILQFFWTCPIFLQ